VSKRNGLVEIVTSDLRALLFWANVGVRQSRGGAYEEEILEIIPSYAEHIKFNLPRTKFKRSTPKLDSST
jgi:hypothetical protein